MNKQILTRFSVAPLFQSTRSLSAVASGRSPADLVITGVRALSTYTDRILPEREIWIKDGRIAALRPAGSYRSVDHAPRAVYDGQGGIIAPGLVDPHVHVESSMMTVCAYAEAALLNGTTTIFCDSHEIGNVADVEGVEWMLEDAREAALNVFLTVPSTVPATDASLETAGGDLTPDKIGGIFDRWPEAVALGEKMDFVPLCLGDERSHGIVSESLRRGRPVSGHVYGREFVAAYAASGVTDTHEAISGEIADDLLEAGVWIFLRGGPPTTPWHSLPAAIRAVTEFGADPKRVCLCTDDRDADDVFAFGMDWVARQAIKAGMTPAQAWSMGSLHGATRFGMDGEFGGLGGGRRADLMLLNDDMTVRNTWYGGVIAVEDRRITSALDAQLSSARYRYPEAAYQTVKIDTVGPLTPTLPLGPVRAHVIGVRSAHDVTLAHEVLDLPQAETWPELLDAHDLCFASVIERHGHGNGIAHGLLRGFGLTEGAVASSVGHDAHNIIVAGRDEASMRLAVETVRQTQGGVVVVREGAVVAQIALPIAGLLSDERATAVAEKTRILKAEWEKSGCRLPYMGFNLIPLSVIPDVRLTDKGLVLVPEMRLTPLFEPVPNA
ncbi:adenine deaminase C-terminal domain-containing protein [Tanticharoenia sakaeratensis]|uniref:Adenine deaminase n=1 Tax=Tanticharoenia sakaeratensis NBRC 103193 TaxID=1231623 RepID=A0A0D6MMK8_9PROT|nr:adenine deaminase C-terminal domain-containing protein [Tanticharoenia sakaeratensis]GAN54904.1 adenine deaminase [Tanticharoenia sakaeratensis NBRC 103193]GBQ23492.1 adenine deaminase [Tanticharoenia sakaeratensis NBRC 103193]